jgi:hypothetical protein
MRNTILRMIALWCVELMIFIPFSVTAFQIGFAGNPVESVTYNSAKISWSSDKNATSRVNYGLMETMLNFLEEDNTLTTKHTIVLKNLQNNTQYFFEFVSRNSSGATLVGRKSDGSCYSFKTERTPDLKTPIFTTNVTLNLPQDTSASFQWSSDELSTSFIFYGVDQSLGQVAVDTNLQTSHSFSITVNNHTQYYYKAGMCDKNNNCINTTIKSFMSGMDLTPPEIAANVPEFYNNRFLTIIGKTDPLAIVQVYVNGGLSRWARSSSNGDFKILSVELLINQQNSLRIEATDQVGNKASKDYQVTVETQPPIATISGIPGIAKSQTLQIGGSVNKLCSVTFSVYSTKDLLAPSIVTGLASSAVGTNSVRLNWNKNPEPDVLMYAVYRDGMRITTTRETLFIDTGATVDSGKTYTYKVSAVDQSCNEGQPSDELVVKTMSGGQSFNKVPTETNLSCKKYFFTKTISVSGDFSESVTLEQGINNIKVEVRDRAGNTVTFQNTTLLDTQAPRFLETNLDKVSPTYIADVTLRGKVSEESTINVYVNNDTSPSKTAKTDAAGNFNLDITLRRDVQVKFFDRSGLGMDSQGATYRYGDAWGNKIRIVAVDRAGLKAEASGNIILAQCGFGSWWKADRSLPTPDMITPRLIIEGMAQIGIAVNISWQGGWDNGTIRDVNLRFQTLSTQDAKNWDKDWVIADYMKSPDKKKGYVLLKLKPQQPLGSSKNVNMFQQEENISNHRVGECGVPGFGCVKLPLMLVIDFDMPSYNFSMQQRQCWDVMVTIDRRISPEVVPEEFLKSSITVLNATINVIDAVLKPLKTIKEYVFYSCAASWVIDFVLWIEEAWSCQYTSALDIFTSGGKTFDKRIAETNQCDVYGQQGSNDNRKETCESCRDSVQYRRDFENKYMHLLCDRIFCPSVPTLQNFIRGEATSNPVTKIPGYDLYAGSDCAAIYKDVGNVGYSLGYAESPPVSLSVPKTVKEFYLTTESSRQIYDNYLKYNEESGTTSCNELHSPRAECCGAQYMNQWDEACLVMDELKENVCWHAENENKLDSLESGENPIQCAVTWNKVAGICAPEGQVQAELVKTQMLYQGTPNRDENTFIADSNCVDTPLRLSEDDRTIYYRIMPPNGIDQDYHIQRGYILTRKRLAEVPKTTQATAGTAGESLINQEIVFRPTGEELSQYFFTPGKLADRQKEQRGKPRNCGDDPYCGPFKADLIKCANPTTLGTDAGRDKKALDLYNEIQEKIGRKEKDYIVEPPSGFLRSIQCVCLSAITGYLNLYRSMLQAIMSCFQSILITGDGSAGLCRSVLTVYVCDLIYDIIRCAMEKYGGSYYREKEGSLGNIVGALTAAGEGVQRSVAGRYGASTIWQAMFAERKIVHSLCLFAFTGTWNIDVANLMNQDFPLPVKSEGFLYPCERRFASFNPLSNPSGLATWTYHFGVGLIAGAELNNIKLTLSCSNDFSCNTQEGFALGQCDCKGGAKTLTVDGIPNYLKPGDMIFGQGDIYKNLQDNVRYDKARLEWTYIDNNKRTVHDQVECNIKQVGGQPPAFCKFDLGSGSYRCELSLGTETWVKFNSQPSPQYYPGMDSFRVGQVMQFNTDLNQQIPENAKCTSGDNCDYTKYLKVVVENQNGKVVYSNEGQDLIRLNTKGRLTDLIQLRAIKKDDFSGSASSRPAVSPVDQAASSNNMVNGYADLLPGFNGGTTNIVFSIKFTSENGATYYQIFDDGICQAPKPGYDKTSLSGREVVYNNMKITTKTTSVQGCYRVSYQPSQATDVCTTGSEKQVWRVTFQILDATQDGASYVPSNQVTVYQGKPQQYLKLPFLAQCDVTATGATTDRCPDPTTKPLSYDCYCAVTVTVDDTGQRMPRDCTAGKYCVDKTCINAPGCDNGGSTKATQGCVCNGKTYPSSDSMCTQNQYCKGDNCSNELTNCASKACEQMTSAECNACSTYLCVWQNGKCTYSGVVP